MHNIQPFLTFKRATHIGIWVTLILSALALAASAVVSAQAQSRSSPKSAAMLSSLSKGQWNVRFRDGSPSRNLCLRNGQEIVQVKHENMPCNRYVLEDGAKHVTVQYSCPGKGGYGRTSIRKESANMVHIEGQGIKQGRPFEFVAEARRTGTCS